MRVTFGSFWVVATAQSEPSGPGNSVSQNNKIHPLLLLRKKTAHHAGNLALTLRNHGQE